MHWVVARSIASMASLVARTGWSYSNCTRLADCIWTLLGGSRNNDGALWMERAKCRKQGSGEEEVVLGAQGRRRQRGWGGGLPVILPLLH